MEHEASIDFRPDKSSGSMRTASSSRRNSLRSPTVMPGPGQAGEKRRTNGDSQKKAYVGYSLTPDGGSIIDSAR